VKSIEVQLVLPFGRFEQGLNRLLKVAEDQEEEMALREIIEEWWERQYGIPASPPAAPGE
jgi:hypothetical protein